MDVDQHSRRTDLPNAASYVALAGGANVDIHGRSSQPLRKRDSNPGTVRIAAGGVARNVAENLARLGIDARLISAVGDDQHGKFLLRHCRDAGVDTISVQQIASAATSTYLSLLDDDGDMLAAVNDMQIFEQLRVDSLQCHSATIENAAIVMIDANLPTDVLDWILARTGATPVFADAVSAVKTERLLKHLQRIHTLKASVIEVEALTGQAASTSAQLGKAAAQLHAAGVDRVFVTRGARGVFYSDGRSQATRAACHARPTVENAGGAGDAFLAGLIYAWLRDWDLAQSVNFAMAAADLTLTHQDTNHPEMSESRVRATLELKNA